MKHVYCLMAAWVGGCASIAGAEEVAEIASHDKAYYEERTQALTYTNKDGETMPYRLFTPNHIDLKETYPLLLILHGAGARGLDNKRQLTVWNSGWVDDDLQKKHPCFIVMPQCPRDKRWVEIDWRKGSYALADVPMSPQLKLAHEIFSTTIKDHAIDTNRLYIMGASMGGCGTWHMIMRYPKTFAAAVPICGVGDPTTGSVLTDLPIWAFHGESDRTIPVLGTCDMLAAIKAAGGTKAKATIYPEVGHGSYHLAWKEEPLSEWVFAQKRNQPDFFNHVE